MSDVILVATSPDEYANYMSLFSRTLRNSMYREATLAKTQGLRFRQVFVTEEAAKVQDVMDTLRQSLIAQSYSVHLDSYPVVLSMTDDMRNFIELQMKVIR